MLGDGSGKPGAAPACSSEPRHALTLVLTGWAGLQVCVVALKKGQLQVLSNAWDRDLGGRNLDLVLFEHFAK